MLTPARLLAVATSVVALVLGSAVSASADAPTTWETHDGLSDLEYLGLLFGIPIAMIVVIWVLASVVHRKNFVFVPRSDVERHQGH